MACRSQGDTLCARPGQRTAHHLLLPFSTGLVVAMLTREVLVTDYLLHAPPICLVWSYLLFYSEVPMNKNRHRTAIDSGGLLEQFVAPRSPLHLVAQHLEVCCPSALYPDRHPDSHEVTFLVRRPALVRSLSLGTFRSSPRPLRPI